MGIIYAIRHEESGKLYVGSTIRPKIRKREHFKDLKVGCHFNRHLQHAFNKYGEAAFEFVVLEEVGQDEDLKELELSWITKTKATDPTFGYNLSLDTKAPMRGLKMSTETRQKLSDQRKGSLHVNAKVNESVATKIFELFEQGLNQKQIAVEVGLHHTNISLILRGKAWRHVESRKCRGRTNNTSGCVGVYYDKNANKWKAEIIHKGVYHGLGMHNSLEKAVSARRNAEVTFGL